MPGTITDRMLRAVASPHADIVGHPTGRRLGSRPGAVYDFEAVFPQAAKSGTALEMDCDPTRMDLSPELPPLAPDFGSRPSLASHAPTPNHLTYAPPRPYKPRQTTTD